MEDRQHDPRPDLEEDHGLWEVILHCSAEHEDERLYGMLHGLRCCGARLHWDTRGKLRLDYQAAAAETRWSEDQVRFEWLVPQSDAIKKVFSTAETRLRISQKAGPPRSVI